MSANSLLIGSLLWYATLTCAFAYEANVGKSLYFFGAWILTIGVYLME
jgi:hypothetical protein